MHKIREQKNIENLKRIVGGGNLLEGRDQMLDFAHDEFPSSDIARMPLAVVLPRTAEQVSNILAWAREQHIPVTARGGGTGMCGGCVPSAGGIVLSLEKFNRICEVDELNQMAVVEPGVRLMDFYHAVEEKGLFFPPHPGDETATIGGVIATNAGGSRALKYGVVRNFIRGLDVVFPGGEIARLGGKLLKNSTGYNLLQLMIGSEGTLGIITQAIISLMPPPNAQMTLIAPFDDLESAVRVIPALSRSGIIPMAVEFVEVEAVRAAEDYLDKHWPCKTGNAHLMIIVDGFDDDEVLQVAEQIGRLCGTFGSRDVFVAERKDQQKEILDIRSHMFETIKTYIIEVLDIVVPPSEVPAHVGVVHRLARDYGMWLPTFGHVSDGNVHTHIMKARYQNKQWIIMPDDEWKQKYPAVRKALHDDARTRGGLVSGEHGIGLIKKEYLANSVGPVAVAYMKKIKRSFDPHNLLNPDKIFAD